MIPRDRLAKIVKRCTAIRRDLHRHPELSFKEKRTGALIAKELRRLGLQAEAGVAGTGVIAHLRGSGPGPVLALRADIDALPLRENTGRPYISVNEGVHHACGHDGHTAILLGTAMAMAGIRKQLRGTVKFVFQPAEEVVGGAERLVRHKAWKKPKADLVVALHAWPGLDVGRAQVNRGVAFASAARFRVEIRGRGGHGSAPEMTRDPVAAMAQSIMAVQTIKSREIAAQTPAVISICHVQAGAVSNVLPDTAVMSGTVRALTSAGARRIVGRIRTVVDLVCRALRCESAFECDSVTEPCVNDARMTGKVAGSLRAVFGRRVTVIDQPSMGAEDFAWYTVGLPGVYFRLGIGSGVAAAHSPEYDFDDRAIPWGIEAFARIAGDFCGVGLAGSVEG